MATALEVGRAYLIICRVWDRGRVTGTERAEAVFRGNDGRGRQVFTPADGGPDICLYPDEIEWGQ